MAFYFGSASKANLVGVNPKLVKIMEAAIVDSPRDFRIQEGLRSREQQIENYNKGVSRTIDGSKHLASKKDGYGRAVDIYPTKLPQDWGKRPELWLPILTHIMNVAAELGIGIKFGYTWTSNPNDKPAKFLDAPHIELLDSE
ncbi:endolysin [Providencia phage vB_PreS_PR1]|uniref:Endolysin n=1 Tax=Providencia phage vB_PreS_PR1 TaxID=1931407 RepID=A0A1S6KV18_9CAUD|nr:endolysin [Providencia phage vB_PreS_PR1]AQT25280.1 endolysin [Providencia phage vB_PreS_PR1]